MEQIRQTTGAHRRWLIALPALLLLNGCPIFRATGDTVNAAGHGVGHAVKETGRGVGHVVTETGRGAASAVHGTGEAIGDAVR